MEPLSRSPIPPSQPTFSGLPHEDVNVFIRHCRATWDICGLSKSDLDEARLITLQGGCKGAALDYINTLGEENRGDFYSLANNLAKRFPSVWELTEKAVKEMFELNQGNNRLREYIEKGFDLKHNLPGAFQVTLAERWTRGLSNRKLREHALCQVDLWKMSNTCTIEKAIDYVLFTATGN